VFTQPIVGFIARRLLYSLVVLLGVLVVVFALVHLVPGDPVRIALGTRFTPDAYDALRSASGLDRPIVEQFFGYIGSALTGNLGVSFRNGDPVTVTLLERLPATVSLGLVGIVIALLIALPAGIWSALHEGRVSDAIVRVTSQLGVSIPDFWLGILLIALFATTLGWLPTSGRGPTTNLIGIPVSFLTLEGLRHLALQPQDIAEIPLIRLRPEVLIRRGLDQLGRDPHAVARAHHRSFHNTIHPQLPGNLRHTLLRASVAHRGGPGDHAQGADFSQVRNEFVRHPIGKIVLLLIARKIFEWKNDQGSGLFTNQDTV